MAANYLTVTVHFVPVTFDQLFTKKVVYLIEFQPILRYNNKVLLYTCIILERFYTIIYERKGYFHKEKTCGLKWFWYRM